MRNNELWSDSEMSEILEGKQVKILPEAVEDQLFEEIKRGWGDLLDVWGDTRHISNGKTRRKLFLMKAKAKGVLDKDGNPKM